MEYIKQFPDVMAGKKVMYVHGFASSAQSGTVRRLRQVLCNAEIIAEDIPLHPQEAIDLLHRLCDEHHPDLIIGTSMGGMYTEMLYGYNRIVINPAFQIGDTMVAHGLTGAQSFQNPRQDGVQDFIVTKAMVKEYREITTHCFSGVTEEERRRVWGLFGDNDTLIDTFDLFRQHYPTAIPFHGEHRMDDRSYMHAVMPIVRWIDDRQEHRERPVIFISYDSVADQRGMPRSSSQKAFRHLIETYQVYFVVDADYNSRQTMPEAQQWLWQAFDAPAYNHVICTCQPHLLYGDFLISTVPCDEFLGTVIQLGTGDFKSWEDIIIYFDRLMGM